MLCRTIWVPWPRWMDVRKLRRPRQQPLPRTTQYQLVLARSALLTKGRLIFSIWCVVNGGFDLTHPTLLKLLTHTILPVLKLHGLALWDPWQTLEVVLWILRKLLKEVCLWRAGSECCRWWSSQRLKQLGVMATVEFLAVRTDGTLVRTGAGGTAGPVSLPADFALYGKDLATFSLPATNVIFNSGCTGTPQGCPKECYCFRIQGYRSILLWNGSRGARFIRKNASSGPLKGPTWCFFFMRRPKSRKNI